MFVSLLKANYLFNEGICLDYKYYHIKYLMNLDFAVRIQHMCEVLSLELRKMKQLISIEMIKP